MLSTKSSFSLYPTAYTRGDAQFDGPDDFTGKTVAVVRGARISEEILEPYVDRVNVIAAEGPREVMQLLFEGQADVMIGLSLSTYLISKYQLVGLKPAYVFWERPVDAVMGMTTTSPLLRMDEKRSNPWRKKNRT